MPVEMLTLGDIEQTVSRPAIYQVIDQMASFLKLPKDIEILYAGKRGTMSTHGSHIDDQEKEAKFSTQHYLFLSVKEDYDTVSVTEITPYSYDQQPIFLDGPLSIRPVYTTSNVEIEITYRHSSESEIRKWLASMIIKVSQGREMGLHDIVYMYPIPPTALELLLEVYKLREQVEPYNETFNEYFVNHRAKRMGILTDHTGKNPYLAVKEHQTQIVGLYDHSVIPDKPEYQKDLGTWEGRITYKFNYQRPDAILIRYPISIHNQYLPDKYLIDRHYDVDYQEHKKSFSASLNALQYFSCDRQAELIRPIEPFIRIPQCDDFGADRIHDTNIFPQDTATIFIALCFLDHDRKIVAKLNDLGDYIIDSDILKFFKDEAPYLTKWMHSLYNVTVYRNEVLVNQDEIEVLPDLTVQFKEPQSLRDRYHLRLAIVPSVTKPLYSAVTRFRHYPKALYATISCMNELLRIDPDFKSLCCSDEIQEWMFTSIFRIFNVIHQGHQLSPDTSVDTYLDEYRATTKHHFALLTKLSDKQIKDYFNSKRRIWNTQCNAYVVVTNRSILEKEIQDGTRDRHDVYER